MKAKNTWTGAVLIALLLSFLFPSSLLAQKSKSTKKANNTAFAYDGGVSMFYGERKEENKPTSWSVNFYRFTNAMRPRGGTFYVGFGVRSKAMFDRPSALVGFQRLETPVVYGKMGLALPAQLTKTWGGPLLNVDFGFPTKDRKNAQFFLAATGRFNINVPTFPDWNQEDLCLGFFIEGGADWLFYGNQTLSSLEVRVGINLAIPCKRMAKF